MIRELGDSKEWQLVQGMAACPRNGSLSKEWLVKLSRQWLQGWPNCSRHGCQAVQSMAVKGMAGGSVQVIADQGSDCMIGQTVKYRAWQLVQDMAVCQCQAR